MKFTSPMGGIQQASASETAVENVRPTPGFYFLSDYKRLDTSLYFMITNFHTETEL